MKIGLCYDTKSDYGIDEESLEYTDFVSLHTISELSKAMERCGYEVEYIGNVHKLKEMLKNPIFPYDLVFNIAEGFGSRNREAWIPSLLEIFKIPHTASDTYGMALNLNKHHTKILVQSQGIPVPRGVYFEKLDESVLNDIEHIGYPLILKPNSEGGSMGLFLIHTKTEFIKHATALIKDQGFDLLAEEYIDGTEVTVPIIGNRERAQALGVVSILNKDGTNIALYDTSLKYEDNVINTLDFKFGAKIKQKLMEYSVNIHRFFDLRDYSRMDFRVRSDGSIYFLEINSMPSLCRGGSFEQCGAAMGLDYHEVIGMIIAAARDRYQI
ncbi:ATP-grasp domain-containing protein [Desulfitobacterium sp. PCE1]|uniref:D-alanine--D-alanine ligase family protein n=1 Tax=Desulfitobacterium sp. PCE1 TaxID=146907 RepID=UPI00036ED187|nr:ATP-grasp domain-containing protein [Desulfitobacterium sp. PCE1]